ncbi:hypothetical protein N7451_006389 [Penicillium sp. IBT 35674x]|nr:hypothetical protein N7451_006389 [Penicillium sp. IBT 35674x]
MTDDESTKSPVVPSKRKGDTPARPGKRTKKDAADKEYERIAYGSVKDPTPRKRLNVKRLDLDWTYVGGELAPLVEGQGPVPEKPARKRWQHHGPEPLTDYNLVPDDWSAYDDDIDAEDLEGQVERCKERITDNILPHIFEARLQGLELELDRRVKTAEREAEGLSWNVIKRIQHLRMIGRSLYSQGDPQEKLVTIMALLDAYNTKTLEWTPGLVTYWQKGRQLCQPRPFDWDEYEAVQREIGDIWSFWVEGLMTPGPAPQYPSVTSQREPANPYFNTIRLAVRIPGLQAWAELDFLWDTGACMMNIYQGDLNIIMGANAGDLLGNVPGRWNAVPSVGSIIMAGVGGILAPAVSLVELEITMLDANRQRIIPWTRVQASVNPGVFTPGGTDHRLDGPWLRSLLFLGSAPDNNLNRQVIFSTCKSMALPALNVARVPRVGMAYGAGFFAPPVDPVQLIATPGLPYLPGLLFLYLSQCLQDRIFLLLVLLCLLSQQAYTLLVVHLRLELLYQETLEPRLAFPHDVEE